MPAMAAQQPPKKAADAPKGTGAQASAPQKKENGGLMARLRDLPQAAGIALSVFSLLPLLLYSGIIFFDATMQTGSEWIGLLAVRAAFTQLMGYGCGFLQAWWRRCVRGKDEFSAYRSNFYK